MVSIVRATDNDFKLLADLAKQTFMESHGSSAKQEDLDVYMNAKLSYDFLEKDVSDSNNIYHIIYHEGKPVGFSKIILNTPGFHIDSTNVTKLEKIFILKECYNLKLGQKLLNHNLAISKENEQSGIWLFVWIENQRAIAFYTKNGFEVVGNHDFKISTTHTNPNYQMFLKYQ
jgi:ribosomal protein S18 acetylase RimI-like enzyme